ncbi:amidohydrolase [Corynebacterium sp. USCH3]|uniref:amidohydrolase n=1 Tax=Corynebacterium sp. USCH3 TaxID=3024840 RepID=UPI00403FB0BB
MSTLGSADSVPVVDAVAAWTVDNHDTVLGWRRHLHAHPELSHQETGTTQFIVEKLTEAGLTPRRLPGTGVTVDIGGDGGRPAVAFRADIDALPLTEVTGLDFASRTPGVMHACGHDIHTTVVLGLACALAEYDREHGLGQQVRCIFQPAEEVLDGGATDVIRAGALDGVSHIFAVHAEPKLRAGQIGVRTGAITSATDVVELVVRGPGGHTSRPHLTADVIYAVGLLITQLPGLLSRRVDPRTGTVLTFGAVNGGSAFNAIPQEATLLGTLRTGSPTVWRELDTVFPRLVEQILAPTGATAEIRYTKGVPPVTNDDACTAIMAQAVKDVDPHALQEAPQSSGGEDFSWYLEHVPGAMARLGAWTGSGEKPDLHQPNIVLDEACLPVGIRMFAGVVDQFARFGLPAGSGHPGHQGRGSFTD